jgi:hypothetical protein
MSRHAHGHQGRTPHRRFRDLTHGEQALWSALIQSVLICTATLLVPFITRSETPSPQPVATVQATPVGDIFHDLASSNQETRKDAIANLEIRVNQERDPVVRRAIFRRLVIFVRDHTQPLPEGGSYGYCTQSTKPTFPSEALSALQLIGQRQGADLAVKLDLSDTNLAYASLPSLRLNNIVFDGALLCRTVLTGSTFNEATFVGATLRYAFVTGAVGIGVQQLADVYSLCGTELPLPLRSNATLRRLEATDPEPHLRCQVH